VAVTETSPTLPIVPTPAPESAPRATAPTAAPDPTAAAAAPSATADSAAKAAAAPLGFALHFDSDTQRMILEARDPVTGYVIYQMPAKYVIKQLSTSAQPATPRGTAINRKL
jgi:hypothetical protein